MYRTLQRIQQKPESYRKKMVMFSTFGIMFVIIFIWAITIPLRLERDVVANLDYLPEQNLTENSVNNNPFSVLRRSLSNSLNFAKDQNTASAVLSEVGNFADVDQVQTTPKDPQEELEFIPQEELEFLQ